MATPVVLASGKQKVSAKRLRVWTALALCAVAHSTAASTVEQVDVARMLAASEVVFEGVAERHETVLDDAGLPRTLVRFRVLEVLKGHAGPELTLGFAGGAIGDLEYAISDLVIPPVGEHGIYFVESLRRTLVNPLYGWSQGAFRIETGAGGGSGSGRTAARERIATQRGRPVLDVRSTGSPSFSGLSDGVASGITEGEVSEANRALAPNDFKARLRELLLGGSSQ